MDVEHNSQDSSPPEGAAKVTRTRVTKRSRTAPASEFVGERDTSEIVLPPKRLDLFRREPEQLSVDPRVVLAEPRRREADAEPFPVEDPGRGRERERPVARKLGRLMKAARLEMGIAGMVGGVVDRGGRDAPALQAPHQLDRVLIARMAGYAAIGPADGRRYRLVNDRDIFAQITHEE